LNLLSDSFQLVLSARGQGDEHSVTRQSARRRFADAG